MTDDEYNARQENAKAVLLDAGEYRHAVEWLREVGVPGDWQGTPLEYAIEEMPSGLAGSISRFFPGIFLLSKHTVHVPDSVTRSGLRRFTASQFLAEFEAVPGVPLWRRYRSPIRVIACLPDESRLVLHVRRVVQMQMLLSRRDLVLKSVSWGECGHARPGKLGVRGLYALNHALNTAAVRRGGLSIVQHWMANTSRTRGALPGDFFDLLAFLEIRPIFTRQTALNAAPESTVPPPARVSPPETLSIMSYIYRAKPTAFPCHYKSSKCRRMTGTRRSPASSKR